MIRRSAISAVSRISLVCLLTAGCGATGVLDSGRRLEIKVTADRFESVVDSLFAFRLDAKGPGLSDVMFDYGDGQNYVYLAQGATTVGLIQKHAYGTAGMYRVEATARSAAGEALSDHVDVVVR
jgi:hypothetical protein